MKPIRWFKEQETAVQALIGLATIGVVMFVVLILVVALVIGAAVFGGLELDLGSAAQLSQAASTGDSTFLSTSADATVRVI